MLGLYTYVFGVDIQLSSEIEMMDNAMMRSKQKSLPPPPQSQMDLLFAKFDKGLMMTLDKFGFRMKAACDKLSERVNKCERKLKHCFKALVANTTRDLDLAEVLVKKELKSKIVISEWTSKFLSKTNDQQLDPITFAFARFSLNITLCYNDVPAAYFIKSNIHILLISLIGFQSELVVGPALLGLLHLSLHDEMKPAIVAGSGLAAVLKLMIHSDSDLILTQCGKLIASLALHFPNKPLIASSGCYHALFDTLANARRSNSETIKSQAAMAVCNIIHGSDANRVLSIELNGIPPLISVVQNCDKEQLLQRSIQCLMNISYLNSFTSSRILASGGDVVLIDILNSSDIMRQADIAWVSLATLSNICNSETNQAHIGASPGIVEAAIRICEYARETWLVTEAATLLLAIAWSNMGNKARVASKGAISVLLKRFIRHSTRDSEDDLKCIEMLLQVMASLMLYKSNQEQLFVMGGLEELLRIGKKLTSRRLLSVIATVITALVPSPEDILRLHTEYSKPPVERVNAVSFLKRVKLNVFGEMTCAPEWLEMAIGFLSMDDNTLEQQPKWEKKEFVEKAVFFKEKIIRVLPEVDQEQFVAVKGFIFSVY